MTEDTALFIVERDGVFSVTEGYTTNFKEDPSYPDLLFKLGEKFGTSAAAWDFALVWDQEFETEFGVIEVGRE